MPSFWRYRIPNSKLAHSPYKKFSWGFSFLFSFLLLWCLTLFGLWYRINFFLFGGSKIDILQHNLSEIATYISTYNIELATSIARIDELIQTSRTENILKTKTNDIITIRDSIISQESSFQSLGEGRYNKFIQFLRDLRPMSTEVMQLLGKNTAKNYLVILQNTAEHRPNGWFFWSFAFVTIDQWKITTLRLIDSYFPNKFVPDAKVSLPQWSKTIYPENTAMRISANKFWFHDLDGKIMIDLYNKTFNDIWNSNKIPPDTCIDMCNKKINGVIFLRTDMLNIIAPGFERKQWERQFLNACVDLIRWNNLPNKKEKYLSDAHIFFEKNQWSMIKHSISKFKKLTDDHWIGIYLPEHSKELRSTLEKYHLITSSPSENSNSRVYLWDTNTSFNKIDNFVRKQAILTNAIGDIIAQSDKDFLDLWRSLSSGNYTLAITYTIAVPLQYKNFIFWLESQYGIQMTDREKGILALKETNRYDDHIVRLRATRSQIYYPKDRNIINVQWDSFWILNFSTPFSRGLQYKIETAKNDTTVKVLIDFEVK